MTAVVWLFEAPGTTGLPVAPHSKSHTMTNLIPFTFEGNQIRTISNGEPWYVAHDVCKFLDIGNATNAVRNLDDDEKTLYSIKGTSQKLNVINESGLYTLILRCRNAVIKGTPEHRFRKWVTSVLIPAARKNQFEAQALPNQARLADLVGTGGLDELQLLKTELRALLTQFEGSAVALKVRFVDHQDLDALARAYAEETRRRQEAEDRLELWRNDPQKLLDVMAGLGVIEPVNVQRKALARHM